jgi:hypothetical protein
MTDNSLNRLGRAKKQTESARATRLEAGRSSRPVLPRSRAVRWVDPVFRPIKGN